MTQGVSLDRPPPVVLQKILLLTYISPFEQFGAGQRTKLLMTALQKHGLVEVLVLHLGQERAEHGRLTISSLGGVRVMDLSIARAGWSSLPRFDVTSTYVTEEVARHVDLASYRFLVSRYIKPALKLRISAQMPLIVDFDDAVFRPPWQVFDSAKMWAGALLRLFNDRVVVRATLRVRPGRHRHFFFCGEAERRAFPRLPGSVLPNLASPSSFGADPPAFLPPQRPALLFIGLLDYLPNKDAVTWFVDEIWPLVRRRVPNARFLIVGAGARASLSQWGRSPGVEALGFVESLPEIYRQVSASVVPIRAGAGTNIKALEAYGHGRMVVATPEVRMGHGTLFRDGTDMLTASDAATFAAHCVSVLTDPARAEKIARSGHLRITTLLTRERFQETVDAAVRDVLWTGVPGGGGGRDAGVQIP